MEYFASKELIKNCKELVKDPDAIMDLYDQTFAWASDKAAKLLGFSHKELSVKRVLDIRIKDTSDEEDLTEHTSKNDYIDIFPMRTKDGKEILIKARVKYIKFNEQPYQIIKVLEVNSKRI